MAFIPVPLDSTNDRAHRQQLALALGTLQRNKVLSPDQATARTALGLGTAAVLDTGTAAGDVVKLETGAKLPAVDGSQLTGIVSLPAGILAPYAGAMAPTGWLLADGSAVSRTTYASLFTAVGTTYGAGDHSTTFNLPDLRGRVPAGFDSGNATGRLTNAATGGVSAAALGNAGGEQDHQLLSSESGMPAHTPTASFSGSGSGTASGGGVVTVSGTGSTYRGVPDTTIATADALGAASPINEPSISVSVSGSVTVNTVPAQNAAAAHNVVQPTIVLNYIIKT